MYQSFIETSGHEWDKKNLVSITKNGGIYDEMVCKNCKMEGRRYGFITVEVPETYKVADVHDCPKAKPIEVPEIVMVTRCTALGNIFGNLTPGTVHDVVEPPTGEKNDRKGVWVMGVGQPVKLLVGEFVDVAKL
jgi:hypothetical protein